jgi:hypothetical protein
VNRDEAKNILLCYRPGTADEADPQVAEALALSKQDAELASWLKASLVQQEGLRQKFRQIPVPAGLKEQIISEQRAKERSLLSRHPALFAGIAALVAVLVFLAVWFPARSQENTLAIYQNQMAGVALRGYNMDLATNDVVPIRKYLAQNQAPADFVLPVPLQKAEVTGCAVQNWQAVKVSMVCFRTGKPLPPGEASDLWLFVVDQTSVAGAPADERLRFIKVNQLTTAVWAKGGKLYLLGATGDQTELQKFL